MKCVKLIHWKPEDVEQVKQLLPDAVYNTWDNINQMLEHAITNQPREPVFVESTFAGYAGKPLVEKLGINRNKYMPGKLTIRFATYPFADQS
jgi:hypothetical protein